MHTTARMSKERRGHQQYSYEHRRALWEAACTSERAFQEQIKQLKTEFNSSCIRRWRSVQSNMTMLHLAAEYGYADTLETLVASKYADYKYLKAKTRFKGDTALMLASAKGHSDCVKLLIEKSKTALAPTIKLCSERDIICSLLQSQLELCYEDPIPMIESDKIVDKRNRGRYTALMLAITGHHEDTANLLLDAGCRIVLKADDQTALTLAAKEGLCKVVKKILAKIKLDVQTLLDLHAHHIQLVYNDVRIALKNALNNQHEDVAILLLDFFGWDNSELFSDVYSIFILAVKNGCGDIIDRLFKLRLCDFYQDYCMEVGSDPVIKLKLQPVHLAAFNGHIHIVAKLIELGADVNTPALITEEVDSSPLSAIVVAIIGQQEDWVKENMVKYLIEEAQCTVNSHSNYCGSSALSLAIEMEMEPLANLLLQHGCDKNKIIENFEAKPCKLQAVHIAAIKGYKDLVFMLLESTDCAPTDSLFWDDYRKVTILHIALIKGYTNIVEKLLAKNVVDINAQMPNGDTALTLAVDRGHLSIVNLLLQDTHCDTSKSLTVYDNKRNLSVQAVHIAALKGYKDILERLLEHVGGNSGATAKWAGQDGWTILHLATINRHVECVRYIVNMTDCNIAAELDVGLQALARRRAESAYSLATSREIVAEKRRHSMLYRQIAKIIADKTGPVEDDVLRFVQHTAKHSAGTHSVNSSEYSIEEYSLGAQPLGIAVIITNRNFRHDSGMSDRPGTEIDREKLFTVLTNLGLRVHEYNDLTAVAMFDCMKHYSQQDQSPFGCFISCIMSHGTLDDIAGVDGARQPVIELTKLFVSSKCSSLKDKPKMFIWVACKGSRDVVEADNLTLSSEQSEQSTSYAAPASSESATNQQSAGGSAVCEVQCDVQRQMEQQPVNLSRLLPESEVDKDFLIAYSTLPGNVSYRIPNEGSPFIKHLTKNLKKYGAKETMEEILNHTNKRLENEVIIEHGLSYKVRACKFSTLHKKFILKSSGEERDVDVPKYVGNVADMAQMLEELTV